jgi:TPR repeat protein
MERAGHREGADRLYEQAAHRGDVVALARLAALRGYRESPTTSNDPDADRMFEAAAAEGNTAVLFGLAAAGHGRALRLLARLREDASWPWR